VFLVSDSGSFSSNHSSFRRSQKPSSGLTPLCEQFNGSLVSEELENQDESDVMMGDVLDGNDDIIEEAQTEEPTTGVDVVSLDEDVVGIDEDEDEIEETIRSFEDSHNTENDKRDRDSLRIDETDGMPCRAGTGTRQLYAVCLVNISFVAGKDINGLQMKVILCIAIS
jgi:hypothetical protein